MVLHFRRMDPFSCYGLCAVLGDDSGAASVLGMRWSCSCRLVVFRKEKRGIDPGVRCPLDGADECMDPPHADAPGLSSFSDSGFSGVSSAAAGKRGRTGKRIQGIALGLLALITFPDTFRMAKMDVLYPFSHREQMAYYIRTHVPAESRIITFPADLISSTLTAYLPEHRFYNCRTNKRYRFYTRKEGIPAAFSNALLHHYAPREGKKEYYLLFSRSMISFYRITPQKLSSFRDFRLEVCFYTDPPAFFPAGEDYLLLKVIPR